MLLGLVGVRLLVLVEVSCWLYVIVNLCLVKAAAGVHCW